MKPKIVSFEKGNYDEGEVLVDKVSVTYSQSADSSGEDVDGMDGAQEITLTTRNNGCARFVNIKTDSWSVEDTEELDSLIEDFYRRASIEY